MMRLICSVKPPVLCSQDVYRSLWAVSNYKKIRWDFRIYTQNRKRARFFWQRTLPPTSISQGLGLLTSAELTGKKEKWFWWLEIDYFDRWNGPWSDEITQVNWEKKFDSCSKRQSDVNLSSAGSISKYLSRLTMSSFYQSIRHKIDSLVSRILVKEQAFGR